MAIFQNPSKRYVYPDGPTDALVAFVGEAPGAEEERHGRGFIGPSGELLFRLASTAGIFRNTSYVTNVVKEKPAGNDITPFIEFKKGGVVTSPAYNEYEQHLYSELSAIKANVVVAVGGVAMYALTRQTQIMKRRGSILTGIKGRKVIPIIHPAAALRQYTLTHLISRDMKRIADESAFPDIRLPSRNLLIRPSFLDSMAFLKRCLEAEEVAYDIEVMNEEVSCISFALSPFDVISIPFVSNGADYFTVGQEAEIWRSIAMILEDEKIIKIGQNLTFDATFLFSKYGIKTRNIKDTMISQAIAFPDFPKGLDFITSIHTKEPYYKDEGKKWFKLGGSEQDFWVYNAKDSAVCIEALPRIEYDLQQIGNLDSAAVQTKLIGPLTYMQVRGIKCDVKGMQLESQAVEKKIAELSARLREVSGYDFNPKSSQQVQDYFYKIKGEKPYINRTTGKPTADKNAIKRLSRKGYEEAQLLQEISKLSYFKSHYLDVSLDVDGRLRCSFNPVGTESGRLSSSETIFGTGTNMQNLPEEFRRFLIADDDCLLINMDLSQAENRIVAYIAPEPNMIAAFENGIDIHKQTAGLIFGKPLDMISDEVGSSSIGGGKYSERFWGKKANHGLNYDLGYKTFAFYYEIEERDAKFIVEQYHKAYPGVRQYHAWVRAQMGKNRTLENLFGRKRLYLDRWSDDLFKSAYSYIPQSTCAEVVNRYGLIYTYYNQDLFRPVDLLLQVHDSMLFQVNYKKWSWEEIARCLIGIKKSLETPLHWRGTSFSIPAGCEVGINMSKDKKVKNKMVEVKGHEFESVSRLAGRLYEIYEQFRTSLFV